MYSPNLISLVRKNNNISDVSIAALDDFLGHIGQDGIFKENDLLFVLPQKKYLLDILNFLQDEKIIEPYAQRCDHCGHEDAYPTSVCDSCGATLQPDQIIYFYKIIGAIIRSEQEIAQLNEKRQRLLLSSFRILTSKIDKKKRTNENASIILFDIANSTELSKQDPFLSNMLKKDFNQFLKDLCVPYLKRSEGHFLKADGDSAHLYFDNINVVEEFLVNFSEMLLLQPFFEKIKALSESDSRIKTFFKIYHASSTISDYQKPDILTLDFTGMDAFTFNNRVEKKAKELIIANYTFDQYFPYFLISNTRLNFQSNRDIQLHDIQNLGEVNVFLYFMSDIIDLK